MMSSFVLSPLFSQLVGDPVVCCPLFSLDYVTPSVQTPHIEIAAEIVFRADHLLLVREQTVEDDGAARLGLHLEAARAVSKVHHTPIVTVGKRKDCLPPLLHVREVKKDGDEAVLARGRDEAPVYVGVKVVMMCPIVLRLAVKQKVGK